MLRKLTKPLLLLSLCSTLAVAGCRGNSGDDTHNKEQTQLLIQQGKDHLTHNRWGQARETFKHVVDEYDGTNSQARFGIVLADLLSFTDTIRLISSLGDAFAPANADENQFVNQLLTDVIHDLRSKFESIDRNLLIAQGNPAFHFQIDELPIYLSSPVEPSMDLGGTWDRASLFLVDTIVTAVIGALNLADSIDLRLDVLRAYDFFALDAVDTDLDGIQALITYILDDPNYPNFLSVKEDGGNELVIKAGLNFAQAIQNWQTALFLASRVPADQTAGRVVSYKDQAGTGDYFPELDPLADSCAALEEEPIGEPEDRDPFVIFDTELTNGSQRVLEHSACLFQVARINLAWEHVLNPPANTSARDLDQLEAFASFYSERPRINFLKHVLPILASLGSSILNDIDDLPAGLGTLVSADVIMNVVSEILGDSIELDPYGYFNPDDTGLAGNIRGLLPAWTSGGCLVYDDVDTETCDIYGDEFIFEVECPVDPDADIINQFICKPSASEDGPRFDDHAADLADFGLEPLPADGIDGLFPYIAFQDSSMHGVLYLDLHAMSQARQTTSEIADALRAIDSSRGFRAADLMTLNAFIAALSRTWPIETAVDFILDD